MQRQLKKSPISYKLICVNGWSWYKSFTHINKKINLIGTVTFIKKDYLLLDMLEKVVFYQLFFYQLKSNNSQKNMFPFTFEVEYIIAIIRNFLLAYTRVHISIYEKIKIKLK